MVEHRYSGQTDWNASRSLIYTQQVERPQRISGGVITMASQARNIVFGSMGVAGLMGVAAILDLALSVPFGGQMVWDIMLLLAAAIVIYMGIDCLKEIR